MHNEEWRRDYSRLHFYGKVVESASFRMWNIYGHTIGGHYLSTIFRKMYDYLDRRKIITTFAPLLKANYFN